MLADAGSTPAASTISFNVVDQHRPPNPKYSLGFCGLPQFSLLVLNSPYLPMFGHTVGTRVSDSVISYHISTWNGGTRREYSAIPCGYVSSDLAKPLSCAREQIANGSASRRKSRGLSPVIRTFYHNIWKFNLMCLCLVIQAQSLMGGTNTPQKGERKP